jgi:hypothetical protein
MTRHEIICFMTYPYLSRPVTIDPATLRPVRKWYLLGVAIIVLGLTAGLGAFIFSVTAFPTLHHEFASGESTSLHIANREELTIYTTEDFTPSNSSHTTLTCQAKSGNSHGKVTLHRYTYVEKWAHESPEWQALYKLSVSQPGTYRISCTSDTPGIRFALGKHINGWRIFGGIIGTFAFPGLGILLGGSVILVVAFKRYHHKSRLRNERLYRPNETEGAKPQEQFH